MTTAASGPVLFAYDGSDLAKAAIGEAARQLAPGREALVLTVGQPFDVGFVPPHQPEIDTSQVDAVRHAAEQTAAGGVSLAELAGFKAEA